MTLIIVFGPVSQADLLRYICLEEGPKNSANVLYNAIHTFTVQWPCQLSKMLLVYYW